MTTGDVAAESRPLPLRRRSDLHAIAQRYAQVRYTGLKDPLTLRHYQLREEEFFIFNLLDGEASLEQIKKAFESQYAPRRVTYAQLQQFLSMLHRENLVVADVTDQGETLLRRNQETRWRERWSTFSNPLAIRFRGVNPQRFLDWISPSCRWCFTGWAAALWLLLVLSAALLVLVEFETLQSRLPAFHAFFSMQNLPWFLLAIAVSKILHELGHGIACKHFGGECHEMGLMLLVMTPCLYANVSDAWMLPSKWHRIAVSAAGMIVELALAAFCTLLWWVTEPGLLNSLCLQIMFVCSVSSILFNANPLLRYDGYFVIADLLEVPNLRARSTAMIQRWLARTALGIDLPGERMYPERHKLRIAAYAIAAITYRILIVIAILWFCHAVLEPYGLAFAVEILAIVVVLGMLVRPIWQVHRFLSHPSWRQKVKWTRFAATLAGIGVLAAVGLSIPVPYRIAAPFVVQAKDAERVYVEVGGRLSSTTAPGAVVKVGDQLAQLEAPELEREVVRLKGRQSVLQVQLESLKRRSAQLTHLGVQDPGSQIPATEQSLADVEQQLARRSEEQQRLLLRAGQAGTVIPPRRRKPASRKGTLDSWIDTPLERANLGAYLDTGTLFCLIGDPHSLQAALVVDQQQIEFVSVGQVVRLQLEQMLDGRLSGKITEIAELDADSVAPELIAVGELPVKSLPNGEPELAGVFYQVTVELDQIPDSIQSGGTGRARINASPQPLGRRLQRYLSNTFRL